MSCVGPHTHRCACMGRGADAFSASCGAATGQTYAELRVLWGHAAHEVADLPADGRRADCAGGDGAWGQLRLNSRWSALRGRRAVAAPAFARGDAGGCGGILDRKHLRSGRATSGGFFAVLQADTSKTRPALAAALCGPRARCAFSG